MTPGYKRASLWLVALMMVAMVLAACGDEGTETGGETTTGTTAGETTTGETTAAETTAGDTGGAEPEATAPDTAAPGAATPPESEVAPGDATEAAQEPDVVGTPGAPQAIQLVEANCPDEAQGAQIAYWNGFSGEDGPFMAAIVDKFNQENNQNIQVQHVIQPFTEYYNTLNAAAQSNTLPDVAQIHIDQIATNAARNLIRPIPPEAQEIIQYGEGDFPEEVFARTEFNGEQYSVPLDVHGLVMWYNQEAAEAAGVEVGAEPLSREQFEQLVRNAPEGMMGWPITGGFPNTWMFQILLHQFGGSTFNEEGTEVTFNSEAGVQALQYLVDMQKEVSRANLPVDADINAFKQGNAAAIWNGTWLKSQVTGEVFPQGAGAPIPQIGDNYVVLGGSHTLAMPRHQQEDPAKTAAAACLIRYIVGNSLTWVEGGGHVPALNAVRESQQFQQLEPQAKYAEIAEAAVFPPAVPGITDATGPQALEEAVVNVLSGKDADIQAALDRAAQRANKILEANQQRYGQGR